MTRQERVDQALEDIGRLMGEIVHGLIDALIIALPWLIRLGCVALAVAGFVAALPVCWRAFGGDWIALLPALTLTTAPIVYVTSTGLSWGGLVLAGVIDLIVSFVAPGLSETALTLILTAIVGVGLVSTFTNERSNEDEQQQG